MLMNCVAYRDGVRFGDVPLTELGQYLGRPGHLVWLGLRDPAADDLEGLRRSFNLHPLAAQDAVRDHKRPKLDEYDDDLFVVNLTREGATLFRRDGPLDFQDASLASGLRALTFAFTGFGTGWLDYDNDGFLDLFIANGAVTIIEQLRGQPYPFQQANLLLHNQDGKKFSDFTASAGPALQLMDVSRGAAFGDIDNDGDTDIVVANNNGPVRLLLNQIGNRNPSITVQLSGGLSLNARVGLMRKGAPVLWRRAHSASSYLSASDPRVLFATGGLSLEGLLVEWTDGYRERFPVAAGSKKVTLQRGAGQRN